ncbi:MAG: GNAT family N-acetyltransferase [Lysobacteraceae bacterium]
MSSGITIRQAGLRDISEACRMIAAHVLYERATVDLEGARHRLESELRSETPRVRLWIAADQKGNALGYASATIDYSTWTALPYLHMDCLFVDQDSRGAGIGALLLQRLKDFAQEAGVHEIQCQTPDWNRRAQEFYLRTGAIQSTKARFKLVLSPS